MVNVAGIKITYLLTNPAHLRQVPQILLTSDEYPKSCSPQTSTPNPVHLRRVPQILHKEAEKNSNYLSLANVKFKNHSAKENYIFLEQIGAVSFTVEMYCIKSCCF